MRRGKATIPNTLEQQLALAFDDGVHGLFGVLRFYTECGNSRVLSTVKLNTTLNAIARLV